MLGLSLGYLGALTGLTLGTLGKLFTLSRELDDFEVFGFNSTGTTSWNTETFQAFTDKALINIHNWKSVFNTIIFYV